MVRVYGRVGLVESWHGDVGEARKGGGQAEAERQKSIAKLYEYAAWISAAVLFIGGFIGLIIWVKYLQDGSL